MPLFGKKKPATPAITMKDIVVDPVSVARPDSSATPWSALLPVLRRMDAYAFTQYAHLIVGRPVGNYLVEHLAFDSADQVQIVNTTMFQTWEEPLDGFFATAEHNLGAHTLLGRSVWLDSQPLTGVDVLQPVGCVSAMAFRPDRLAQALTAAGHAGEFIVIPVDRDLLYAVPTSDLGLVERTLDTAWGQIAKGELERPVSPAAYLLAQGHLVEWQPPAGTVVAAKQGRALAYLKTTCYQALYEWLTADDYRLLSDLPKPERGDLLVSGRPQFGVKDEPTPRWLSLSPLVRYTDADDVLIAPLESVLLIDDQGSSVRVPFAVFARECAAILSDEPGLPLPMVRVHGWPSPQMWESMRPFFT